MALRKGIYNINGAERIVFADAEKETVADVLRRIGFSGVKIGCGVGQCGVCIVLIDGQPVRACIKKWKSVPELAKIETIEGIGVADHLHPLQLAWIRYAGVQCGFCTPGFIMSAKGLLAVNPNPTRQEVRDWFTKNNNLCRCTGYKPLVDCVMAAAAVLRGEKTREELVYKMPEDGRIYHTDYPRPDALAKVMGYCDYGADLDQKMPEGTLHIACVWSSERHAKILSIDKSAAEKMPGVYGVITGEEVPGSNDYGAPVGHPRSKMAVAHQKLVAVGKVMRLGDIVALVAADTEEQARAAAKAVKVVYEPLPVYNDILESCLPDSIRIQEDSPNIYLDQPVAKGEDTKPIFAAAEDPNSGIVAVSGAFRAPREPHLPLEPSSAQAFFDEDGVLTLCFKSQFLHSAFHELPHVLGLPPEKLRIVMTPCGGSFGYTLCNDMLALIGTCCLAFDNRPVTLTMTYAEFQRYSPKRSASYMNGSLACSKDGKMLAMEAHMVNDHGAYGPTSFPQSNKSSCFWGYCFDIPNIRVLIQEGLSNQAYGHAYRGFGSPQVFTCGAALVDMMAEKLGMDPWELGYRNLVKEGDTTCNSGPYKCYSIKELYELIKPKYDAALEWKKQPCEEGWVRGVGFASGGYHCGHAFDGSETLIELNPDNSVTIWNSWQEMGQGATVGSMVCAHEALRHLGYTPDRIHLYMNDTKFCPEHGPSGGSRSMWNDGNVICDAVRQMEEALKKDDGTLKTYDEAVAEGLPTTFKGKFTVIGTGLTMIEHNRGTGDQPPDTNLICGVARVEVQPATGKVRICGADYTADIGVIGTMQGLLGQAYGGVFHAMGYAISEDYFDGEKKCATPLGCGFLKCNEVPDDFNFAFIETPRKTNPFGSGGASECFQSVTHMPVANAINDAVGVRITELPATPEKIKAALEKKARGEDYATPEYYLGCDFHETLDDILENPIIVEHVAANLH